MNPNSRGLHVAMIMDGNGRWATARGLPRLAGHRAGMNTVRRVVEQAVDSQIRCLTLFAFSSDNWRRPPTEVAGIFRLLRLFLRRETERLREQGVRLQMIGRRDRLSRLVLDEVERSEAATRNCHKLNLYVAIDYSSRDAISARVSQMVVRLSGSEPASDSAVRVSLEESLAQQGGDVDLLIRTGGEKRLSDFLLWESAYAELLFSDRMWPEFSRADFADALEDFLRRDRRFGALSCLEQQHRASGL